MNWNTQLRKITAGAIAALWLAAAHAQSTNVPLVIATPLSPAHAGHARTVYIKSAQDGLVAPTGLYANALVGGILVVGLPVPRVSRSSSSSG